MFVLSFVVLGLLSGCATNPGGGSSWFEQPAVGAEAYYRESLRVLDDVRRDLPAIQRSAEKAAAIYCSTWEDYGIASEGSAVFYGELVGRSGGVMAIGAWWPRERGFRGVLLYCLRGPELFAADLEDIAFFRGLGCKVFLFGPADLLERAALCGVEVEGALAIPTNDVAGVSMYDFASVAIGWTWTCEFVAACTRLGQMPVMFQSIMVPTGMDRIHRNQLDPATSLRMYNKFEPQTVPPIAAGKLGAEWLDIAGQRLATMYKSQTKPIQQAAQAAVDARANGGALYLTGYTHVLGHIPTSKYNPPHFAPLPRMPKPDTTPAEGTPMLGPKDFVLGMGYNDLEWDLAKVDYVRQSGAKVAWSSTTFKPDRVKPRAGELFIAQPWEYGDADVTVPGYDVKIAPTSGLISVEIYGMINAEINAITQKQASDH